MSDLLPYEQQLAGRLADIPLPDEDKGWDAMRKMLDEDDDDGIVPPPVSTGCRRWGMGMLLLLLLGGIAWGVYKMYGNSNSNGVKDGSVPVNATLGKQKDSAIAGEGSPVKSDSAVLSGANSKRVVLSADGKLQVGKKSDNNTDTNTLVKNNSGITKKAISKFGVSGSEKLKDTTGQHNYSNTKGVLVIRSKREGAGEKNYKPGRRKVVLDETGVADSLNGVMVKSLKAKKQAVDGLGSRGGDSLKISSAINPVVTGKKSNTSDSGLTKTNGSTINKTAQAGKTPTAKRDSTIKKPEEDKPEKKNDIYFSAGLALQQLIPVDGQKSSPYNAFGRKNSFADYIPSAYFRAHLNRAFLQIEFKYGAPQYTKHIAYSNKVVNYDSTTHITTSLVNHVNKTYYHQLPLSIHYNVLPNLSIGAGAVWNKFESAVVTQQNQNSNGLTGVDSITNSKVINVKADSAFAKTYWQFMVETQYTWRRFSLGARYAWGLMPYLTATSATGQTQKERNASLNVFIRYELWRGKKK